MANAAALCSLVMAIASICWAAWCARRLSRLASLVTRREKAPQKWESRLAELAAEVASLSSSFEKVATLLQRQNSRVAMRALRDDARASHEARAVPPVGTSKEALRKFYGLNVTPAEFAKRQLTIVPPPATAQKE